MTLRRHFGVTVAALEPLGGEIDQNFRVGDEEGRTFFARVTQADTASADVAWQNALLGHLALTVPDLSVPRVIHTEAGEQQVGLQYEGVPFIVRVMTWLPGQPLVTFDHHPIHLLREVGETAGRVSLGLSGLGRPTGLAGHDWDVLRVRELIAKSIEFVDAQADAAHVRQIMHWFDDIEPGLANLPHCVVHHDLNDANVLVGPDDAGVLHVTGVVDVGDAMFSVRAVEVAIAAGYAMLRKADPLRAAAEVVAGFHSVVPLTAEEMAVIYPLAAARLCLNAVTWHRRIAESGSEYGRSRSQHVWPTIRQMTETPPAFAEAAFRAVCGLPARHGAAADEVGRALAVSFGNAVYLDARPASDLYDDIDWINPDEVISVVQQRLRGAVGVMGHLDASLVWSGRRAEGLSEPATVRLGSTALLAGGTPVTVPIPGTVIRVGDGAQPLVLRHLVEGIEIYTSWWNILSVNDIGDELTAGATLGMVSHEPVEPGFGTGFQVQLLTSTEIAAWPAPRRIRPSQRATWQQLSADPMPGLHDRLVEAPTLTIDDVVAVRSRLIPSSQRSYFTRPMNLVRGRDVWLLDEDGMAYLDSLNNVAHVGHANPRITAAATRQLKKLNTNSRFMYPQIATYAEKLAATLPDPLEVVFLVNSGSEANDLAMRIVRQVTGRKHIVNIDGAYHGATSVLTGISPNRYKGPGGHGAPPTTHEVRMPDRYRGPYGYDDPQAGPKYAADAAAVIERIDADGRRPAAFIGESLMGGAGTIVFPDGYLQGVYAAARQAGALCISDEVQVGVGRLGPWWGFEAQGVVPDIVTMGKPLGGGHPLGALVTTKEIAAAFDTGMKFFSTFGGNPVSCAIGEAVLDIVEGDHLRERAVEVGTHFATALRQLQKRQPLVGDVRGRGLYLGVELVRDRATKEPARREAFLVSDLAKDRGVVTFPAGTHENILKIKPPMTFSREHVDVYVDVLDDVLSLRELNRRD
ncbi:MAG: aminotransferase class III-fold pyridoxal phosphate-dependent enzyme [Mycobacterium sp.]